MMHSLKSSCIAVALISLMMSAAYGQSGGNSGSVSGVVTDPTGAVVPDAQVEIHNPVSQFSRSATTDGAGKFGFPNVPFNPYHVSVNATGFAPYAQDVEVRSTVPVTVSVGLKIAGSAQNVTVEANTVDLLENEPTFHTDVDRGLFDKLPLESQSSSLSSLVTLASPGIAADSNGLFHGLGDHAENSFSLDGQPINDQQSKVFSNQIPVDAIESMEVISGAPPAEYGDKTSVVVNVTTRSGQGMTTPTGSFTTSYGSFGTSTANLNLGYGGKNWGNFLSVGGLNTGRFLDPPEFVVMHDKGNEENVFDRIDFKSSTADSFRLDLGFTRSWFQTPNSYDSEYATPWNGVVVSDGGIGPNGQPVGPADQRSQIKTFNIGPSWTRLINNNTVFTFGGYFRHDTYEYFPSADPFADLGPVDLQRQTFGQDRTLANAGVRSGLSYVKGIHNVKVGVNYQQTILNENDAVGIVDPTFLASLTTASGVSCLGPGGVPIAAPCTTLAPYDLTRGGNLFNFLGHTDVKELALYVEDQITKGNWSFNLGIRGDLYNGLTIARQAEPRVGGSYNIKKTGTVLRVSYARTLETPFNENLVLSSIGCDSPVLGPLLLCSAANPTPLQPGYRNEIHAGLEQAFGKHLVLSGEWITKYTRNAYDFSVLGNTPLTFPIEWYKSKIPGYAGRIDLTNIHGLTAEVVMSSVAARFFTPQIGGAGAVPLVGGTGVIPFRIDHDEKFNQTTHLQYQPWENGPWVGFNWRYDSGLVAGAVPCYGVLPFNTCPTSTTVNGQPAIDLSGLSADQQFEAGLFCGGVRATPFVPLPTPCPASQFGSTLVDIPPPNTENDDHRPPRIDHRNLFDVAIGDDNLFRGDRYKWSLTLTAINVANKYALYNFLSTFSGTHYVTPRTLTAQLGFHF